ncbi:MAG: M56 family metallopeptidase [Crocinitomicaceae bacterium]
MTSWFEYLIEIAVTSTVLYGLYFLLRNGLSNRAKRRLILITPLISVTVALIKSVWAEAGATMSFNVIQLEEVVVHQETDVSSWSWAHFYVLGLLVMAFWSILKISRLFYFFRKAVPYIKDSSIKILSSELKDSFSFFNQIHLSAHLDEVEKTVVLDHELMHVKKGHSYDLVFMEIYHSFFWFNPLMILMKKELIQVHEFEVDEDMYAKYNVSYLSHLLSYALGATSAHLLLTSQFYNKLTLTKRINKMKTKSKNKKWLVAIIPAFALCISFLSWSQTTPDKSVPNGAYNIPPPNGEIDTKPEFKGGQEALFAYIGKNVKYPESAEKNGVEGTVHVEFTVLADGKIENANIKKGAATELDAEALRVVKGMPNWNPGKKDGKPVKTQMVLPITFKL